MKYQQGYVQIDLVAILAISCTVGIITGWTVHEVVAAIWPDIKAWIHAATA